MGVDIRKPLKAFSHYFLEAREKNTNEADTVALLCKFFVDVLGYDEIADIGHEAKAKEKWLDLTLKVDGVVKHVVEAKAASLKLRDKFVDQAYVYATQNNYKWVLLTNGVEWNLYHLTLEEDGLNYEIAFKVSVEPDKVDDAAEKLALLHKKAVKKDELEDYWKRYSAIRPGSVGKALFQECVLKLLRKEIHHDTGLLIDCEDLANALQEMLSDNVREEIGPPKIRHRRASTKKAANRGEPAGNGPVPQWGWHRPQPQRRVPTREAQRGAARDSMRPVGPRKAAGRVAARKMLCRNRRVARNQSRSTTGR